MYQQHCTPPEPKEWPRDEAPIREIADGARRDDLRAYMTHADAPRAVEQSLMSVDETTCLPVTPRNPRLDYTGWRRTRPVRKREQLDPARVALGAEYFDDDHELESAPAAIADDGAVVKIGELAKRLDRKTDAIRNWIELEIIPPAPIRLKRGVRAWPAAEADAIVAAARREKIIGTGTATRLGETNFSQLAWEARTQQQMREGR